MLTEFCIWKIRKELNFYNDLAWFISWTKKKISLFLSKLVETKNSNQEAGKHFFFTICKIIFSCFNACLTFKTIVFYLLFLLLKVDFTKNDKLGCGQLKIKKVSPECSDRNKCILFLLFFLHQVSKICLSHQQT